MNHSKLTLPSAPRRVKVGDGLVGRCGLEHSKPVNIVAYTEGDDALISQVLGPALHPEAVSSSRPPPTALSGGSRPVLSAEGGAPGAPPAPSSSVAAMTHCLLVQPVFANDTSGKVWEGGGRGGANLALHPAYRPLPPPPTNTLSEPTFGPDPNTQPEKVDPHPSFTPPPTLQPT